MNNETNKPVETFEQNFFDWLLSQPDSTEVSKVGENNQPIDDIGREEKIQVESAASSMLAEELDPLDSEEIEFPHEDESQLLTMGEIPTVNNRFETLLQERLKVEIKTKPPRFPWEQDRVNYDCEYPDVEPEHWVPPTHLWASQMQNLRWGLLPIPLTETIFAELLQPCQEIAQSDLKPGSKLVRAVDSLFPGQSQSLNNLAGLVLAGRARDGELNPNQITNYNTATAKQQMLLSLLAAQEIISSLTLSCYLNQSLVQREWQTALGWISIEAEYYTPQDKSSPCLRVKGQLPEAASIELNGRKVKATAERSDPGTLCVELFDLQPGQTYELIIRFLNWEQKPLKFAVCPKQSEDS
ncbi:MAG: hypothetical protein WBA93_10105 [Microcoleaceae cyanobacterium]